MGDQTTTAAARVPAVIVVKECVVGGPITAVSLLPSSNLCVYGQGPFLHRVSILASSIDGNNNYDNNCDDRLLVFPEGGSVHGIRHEDNNSSSSAAITTVFGGRQICFLKHIVAGAKDKTMRVLFISSNNNRSSSTNNNNETRTNFLTFDDWIWDCRLWSSNDNYDDKDDDHGTSRTLLVGLAHNVVHVCKITHVEEEDDDDDDVIHVERLQCIQGTTRCISYCMDLFVVPDHHLQPATVAVGTVTNEILVWSFSTATDSANLNNSKSSSSTSVQRPLLKYHEHSLKGHQGVIHAVKFHPSGRLLASTSDDRTVRLWELMLLRHNNINDDDNDDKAEKDEWILKWTAWGHTARGWDVAFGQANVVLSTGEDGTMRVWGLYTGDALCVARGHACQCVWRVGTTAPPTMTTTTTSTTTASRPNTNNTSSVGSCVAVTGGNDGTVAFYNLQDRLLACGKQVLSTNGETTLARRGTWQSTFSVPDDRPILVSEPTGEAEIEIQQQQDKTCSSHVRPKKKKAKKVQQQILVGMKFTNQRGASNSADGPSLVVATRSGSVWSLDTRRGEWKQLEPWWRHSPELVINGEEPVVQSAQATDGCCMCLHSTMPIMAIGTTRGDIVLSNLRQTLSSSAADANDDDVVQSRVVLCARVHRSVQKLEWLRSDVLLSFHVQSILWWTFPTLVKCGQRSSGDEEAKEFHSNCSDYTVLTLNTGVKGLAISSAYDESSSRLAIGDTRGNLIMFTLSSRVDSDGAIVAPTSVLRGAHQKEHVNALLWKNSNTIISVGNDGHMVECAVDDSGLLVKLLSVPVGSFTGISRIWNVSHSPIATKIIIGGYYGNRFAVVDVSSSGYEFFSIDTGGRQRAIDVFTGDGGQQSRFPASSIVAICQNRQDGRNDIHIHGCGFGDQRTPTDNLDAPVVRHCAGHALHGESIFDVRLFPLDAMGKSIALLTGSEDCSSKISLYRDGVITYTKLLPPQISGIRAVSSCRLDSGSTIVVVGGKFAVQVYLVRDFAPQVTSVDIDVRYLGTGRPLEKLSIDHRINCVEVVSLSSNVGENLLIVAGDSNGSCYLYQFLESSGYASSSGQLLYRDDRPILSLELVKYDDRYLLLIGGTAGNLTIFDLPGVAQSSAWLDVAHTPLLRYDAHSMGTNAITSRLLTSSDGSRFLRICSGGDDQAICLCDVYVTTNDSGILDSASVGRSYWAKEAAMSAIKGIAYVDEQHLVVTGYDQRLTVWRCDECGLEKIIDAAVDIGDVNCLAKCSVGNGNHIVAVGGAGVELLSLVL